MNKKICVIGPNSTTGQISRWVFEEGPEEDPYMNASNFAKQMAEDENSSYFVVDVIGVWCPKKVPVEFIKAGNILNLEN